MKVLQALSCGLIVCSAAGVLFGCGSGCDSPSHKSSGEHAHSEEHLHDDEHHHRETEAGDERGHEGHEGHEDHEEGAGAAAMISKTAVRQAGIGIAEAGPQELQIAVVLNGRIVPNRDKLAHITPRFPGVVAKVYKDIGDAVEEGEALAQIESNESLRSYEVTSFLEGTVVSKHASLGEFIAEERDIYVVADLSTVWADFSLFPRQYGAVQLGQKMYVDPGTGAPPVESRVSYVSPLSDPHTQARTVRAVLENPERRLSPGLFATARIVVETARAQVAVLQEAVQRWEEGPAVFVREGAMFRAQPIELGRKDDRWVEVRAGLSPGQQYASRNSFIVKSELLKSGEAHHHH